MANEEEEGDVVSGTFTWKIDNFSKLKKNTHYSDVFTVGGIRWRILICPKWVYEPDHKGVQKLSLYLDVADASTLPSGWTKYAHFSLTLVNQLDCNTSIIKSTKGTSKEFNETKSTLGFESFMPIRKFYHDGAGYLVNDICIVKAKVDVPIKIGDQGTNVSSTMESSETEHKGQEPPNANSVPAPDSSAAPQLPCSELHDAPGSGQICIEPIDDTPADPSLSKELEEVPTTPMDELIDFRGLGQIEKAFVPLLEEVCSQYPSLIACMLKRSPMFTECAFTALGQLLHFLKTTKVKDMTQDACDRLQLFWKELESFRFDLAWLEPHVEAAFRMKNYAQRAGRMKRLREDVDVLENELKRRRIALAVTEIDLAVAKGDLAKAEEEFAGIDMDSEVGYGRC